MLESRAAKEMGRHLGPEGHPAQGESSRPRKAITRLRHLVIKNSGILGI